MKILHYINNVGSGGAEKLLTDILPLFKNEGHEVHLAYSNSERNVPAYKEALMEKGIKIHDFTISFYNPIHVFKLIRLIKKENYDIVHAHIFPTQYWLAFASFFLRRHVKLIKTEHSVFNNRRGNKFLIGLERLVYGRYHRVIAITREVSIALSTWLGDSKDIVVIENGVNLDQIEEMKANLEASEYRFLNQAHFNILMVGRFNGSSKDQNTLIRSLALLPDHFHLFLAGEGDLMSNSIELATSLGIVNRVHFLGYRSDVYKLMSLASLNVLSTNYEGLSGVTLESLASGRPFLGSDVIGVNNIVPNENFLFSKNNHENLAEKIRAIAQDENLSNRMVDEAMKHVRQYDVKKMADRYLGVYVESLNSRKTNELNVL